MWSSSGRTSSAKLAALVPAPRVHLARYHGVLAPAAAWRPMIVPQVPVDAGAGTPNPSGSGGSSAAQSEGSSERSRVNRRNYSWAQLMRRVFAIDGLECPDCAGRMRILAAIHPPETTLKILDCLGLPSRAPPLSAAVPESTGDLNTF